MGESVVCRCSLHSRRAALTLLLVLAGAGAGAAPGRWPACSRRLPGASLFLELRGGGNYLDDLLDKSESSSSDPAAELGSPVASRQEDAAAHCALKSGTRPPRNPSPSVSAPPHSAVQPAGPAAVAGGPDQKGQSEVAMDGSVDNVEGLLCERRTLLDAVKSQLRDTGRSLMQASDASDQGCCPSGAASCHPGNGRKEAQEPKIDSWSTERVDGPGARAQGVEAGSETNTEFGLDGNLIVQILRRQEAILAVYNASIQRGGMPCMSMLDAELSLCAAEPTIRDYLECPPAQMAIQARVSLSV